MGWRTRRILGLELAPAGLRVVEVSLARGRAVLEGAAAVPLPEGWSVEAAAEAVGQVLSGREFRARSVAIALPPAAGFVRTRENGEASRPPAPAGEGDFLTGGWSDAAGAAAGASVLADRREAARAVDLARQAGLSIAGLTISQVAHAVALGLLANQPDAAPRAGFTLEGDRIAFMLAASNRPLAVRSVRRSPGDAGAGPLRRHASDLEQMAQVYRAVQLSHPAVRPAAVRLIADDAEGELAASLGRQLGVAAEAVRPGAALGLTARGDAWPEAPAAYAAAIGAALTGLGVAPQPVDLLRLLWYRPPTAPRVWFRAAAAVILLLVAVEVAAGWWVVSRRQAGLDRLEQEHREAEPALERLAQARESWRVLGRWIAADLPGRRLEHARILEQLNALFPDARQAYVTQMMVEALPGGGVRITLDGNATGSEVLYDFLGRLNRSGLFEKAEIGGVTETPDNPAYPRRYSLRMVAKGS